jgi:hypothetical protein
MRFLRYILLPVLLISCTTVRPVTTKEINKGTDTVLLKPTIVNNPTKTIETKAEAIVIHDTVKIIINTVAPGLPYTDTTALKEFMESYQGRYPELDEVKRMLSLLLMVKNASVDSQRNSLQQKLDTSKQEVISREKEVAAAKVVIYQIPMYFYFLLVIIIASFFIYLQYVKGKLRRKENNASS